MMNWNEIEVEKKIAQERYRVITTPKLKELKPVNISSPKALSLPAWTRWKVSELRCTLLHLAGQPCM